MAVRYPVRKEGEAVFSGRIRIFCPIHLSGKFRKGSCKNLKASVQSLVDYQHLSGIRMLRQRDHPVQISLKMLINFIRSWCSFHSFLYFSGPKGRI